MRRAVLRGRGIGAPFVCGHVGKRRSDTTSVACEGQGTWAVARVRGEAAWRPGDGLNQASG